MREIHDHADAVIAQDPRAIFETITDIAGLPEWNAAIERVIEAPDGPEGLVPGATWTVELHPARGMRWRSVSTVTELDPDALRFAYRTVNASGNPSYALWSWQLTPTLSGVEVTVSWDVFLETFDRRHFAGPIRRRQLRREVGVSLAALAARVAAATPG
jgi:uncharacterized protein YndB with AHSA1/START domain